MILARQACRFFSLVDRVRDSAGMPWSNRRAERAATGENFEEGNCFRSRPWR